MNRVAGSVVVGVVGALVAGAGCNPPQTRISQLPPYLGSRPEPRRQLPPPRPRPRQQITRADSGTEWLPRGGISKRWDWVVIHHSGSDKSTPQGMRDWHVNGRGWKALGYHFAIGNGQNYGDGRVHVGERWSKQMHGAHCKTANNEYNNRGIGICLIGNLNNHPPTPKQLRALARLLSFLTDRCGIPRSRIKTHSGVTHRTECPGRYFTMDSVIRQMSMQPIAAASE